VRHWAVSGVGPWLDTHQDDAAMWLEHLIGRRSLVVSTRQARVADDS